MKACDDALSCCTLERLPGCGITEDENQGASCNTGLATICKSGWDKKSVQFCLRSRHSCCRSSILCWSLNVPFKQVGLMTAEADDCKNAHLCKTRLLCSLSL